MRRRHALLAMVAAGALLAGGCGDDPELPALDVGSAFDLRHVDGKVIVSPTGRARFELEGTSRVPTGVEVDTREGVVEVSARRPDGVVQKAKIEKARVRISTLRDGAETVFTLFGERSLCTKPPGTETRLLFGDGAGNFRTRGRYGAASVRGTKWGVRDKCASTLIVARSGTVLAEEYATGRRKVLRGRPGAPAAFDARGDVNAG